MTTLKSIMLRIDDGTGITNFANDGKLGDSEIAANGGYQGLVSDALSLEPMQSSQLVARLNGSAAARKYTKTVLLNRLPVLGIDQDTARAIAGQVINSDPFKPTVPQAGAVVDAAADALWREAVAPAEFSAWGAAARTIGIAAARNDKAGSLGTLSDVFINTDAPIMGLPGRPFWEPRYAVPFSAGGCLLLNLAVERLGLAEKRKLTLRLPATERTVTSSPSESREAATITIFQKPGAGPADPGIVHVRFPQAPSMWGSGGWKVPDVTVLGRKLDNAESVFFVPSVRQLDGAGIVSGEESGTASVVGSRLQKIYDAILAKSPVFLHRDHGVALGVKGKVVSDEGRDPSTPMTIAATWQCGVRNVLGIVDRDH